MAKLFVHHFVAADAEGVPRVAHSGEKVMPGLKMHLDGEIMPCQRGFHGSVKALDALQYAPGAIYAPRLLTGTIIEDGDKYAASDMEVLAVVDVQRVCHEFACDKAEQALKTTNVTDERCWNAIVVKRAWLRGEVTDEELDAARAAAWAAERAAEKAAAWAAERDAAWASAWASARDAAWDAAWAAAWAAERAAEKAAAWAADWAATNADLEQRLAVLSGLSAAKFERESEGE